ncbi:MAG: AhpC/TSA family protein [Pseudobdellovibrio sp.]
MRGEDFNEYRLNKLWQNSPAIIIFLRHFACIACRSHALDVWSKKDLYEKTGAQLYFIGNGSPSMIKIFKEELKMNEAWIFTDPYLESFQAAGFKRGFLSSLGPRSLIAMNQLKKAGHTHTKWTKDSGDVW